MEVRACLKEAAVSEAESARHFAIEQHVQELAIDAVSKTGLFSLSP